MLEAVLGGVDQLQLRGPSESLVKRAVNGRSTASKGDKGSAGRRSVGASGFSPRPPSWSGRPAGERISLWKNLPCTRCFLLPPESKTEKSTEGHICGSSRRCGWTRPTAPTHLRSLTSERRRWRGAVSPELAGLPVILRRLPRVGSRAAGSRCSGRSSCFFSVGLFCLVCSSTSCSSWPCRRSRSPGPARSGPPSPSSRRRPRRAGARGHRDRSDVTAVSSRLQKKHTLAVEA